MFSFGYITLKKMACFVPLVIMAPWFARDPSEDKLVIAVVLAVYWATTFRATDLVAVFIEKGFGIKLKFPHGWGTSKPARKSFGFDIADTEILGWVGFFSMVVFSAICFWSLPLENALVMGPLVSLFFTSAVMIVATAILYPIMKGRSK
ncbi:MAG: hypothetical protein FWD15_01460 [Alphaproteobacteria bacterium]|nr:hypothetical protein [Alphaproteobacteria bacterium]